MQIIILLWPSETCLLIFCKTIYIFIHKYHFSAQSLQSCLTLCDPMGCSLPGSSVHGILQEEYWSELPCRLPAALLDTGSNLYLQQLFWSDPVQNQDCLNLVKTVFCLVIPSSLTRRAVLSSMGVIVKDIFMDFCFILSAKIIY